MKIVGIVDIHGNTTHAPALAIQVPDADLLLLGGDLTNFGRAGDALAVLEALAPCAPRLLAVLGNCDYPEGRRTPAEPESNLDRAGPPVGQADLGGVEDRTLDSWSEKVRVHMESFKRRRRKRRTR